MADYERLGKNIKALRVAHGETMEQLAEHLNLASRSSIANYENGSRQPDKEVLSLIAKHYMFPIDMLFHADLTDIEKIEISDKLMWNYIDLFFPIIMSESAMKNKEFSHAYKVQSRLFDALKNSTLDTINYLDNIDEIGKLFDCIDEYEIALKDSAAKVYAAANRLAILFIFSAFIKTVPEIFESNTAVLAQLKQKNDKRRRLLEDTDNKYSEDLKEVIKLFRDLDIVSEIDNLLLILKKSDVYSDLAYYYNALLYVYDLIDNDMEFEWNQAVGVQMMNSFINIENKYAINFMVGQRLLQSPCSQIENV